ncbi:hypothetical protein GCM10023100_63650 [Actinocorallia cavernae]|uniref:Uncharacterized protein n=2 Tax=Actinomycetes TaxID=1760 RepID=A0ABN3MC99_9ACTN
MTTAIPRPAADTAEQTVSAIIRSSRRARSGGRHIRRKRHRGTADVRFVPSILHRPARARPWSRPQIRVISGSPPPRVPVAGHAKGATVPNPYGAPRTRAQVRIGVVVAGLEDWGV